MCSAVVPQSVGEPVSAQDASLGERLAAGGHLPLHVPALPHPLRGATSCELQHTLFMVLSSENTTQESAERRNVTQNDYVSIKM